MAKQSILERFMSKVEMVTESGCWIWMGGLSPSNGYARFGVEGRNRIAHVIAYQLLIGDIPDGLEIDHFCRVRCCVNPWHLEPVTHNENMRRSIGMNPLKTHCPAGHPYDESNTYLYKPKPWTRGMRTCITCRGEARRRWDMAH